MFLVLSESTQKGHSAGYQRCALFVSRPQQCQGFRKSFSDPYERTPFDTIKMRSANCTKVSKGGQKA